MSLAKSQIENPSVLAEFSSEKVVESVVVSGINNSEITIVDTLVEGMPETVQKDIRVQKIIAEIDRLERGYLPLTQDLYHSRFFANPERYILIGMGAFFIIGILFSFNELLGVVGLIGLIVLALFYYTVQRNVVGQLKKDTNDIKGQIVTQMNALRAIQDEIIQAEVET